VGCRPCGRCRAKTVVALSALRALSAKTVVALSALRALSGCQLFWTLPITDNRQLTTDNFFRILPYRRHTSRKRHPACPVAKHKTGSESEGSPYGECFIKWDVPRDCARDKFAAAQHDGQTRTLRAFCLANATLPGSVILSESEGSHHGVRFKKWDVPDTRDKFATAQHDVLCDFVSLCLILSLISGYFSYFSYL
jgi:hypothetical protein